MACSRLARWGSLQPSPKRTPGLSPTFSGFVSVRHHAAKLENLTRPRRKPAEAQCHLVFPNPTIGADGGADALVRSRPPGRLADRGKYLIPRRKSGTRASRADQGVRPTTYAEPSFAKTKWHWAAVGLQAECLPHQKAKVQRPLSGGRAGLKAGLQARLPSPRRVSCPLEIVWTNQKSCTKFSTVPY